MTYVMDRLRDASEASDSSGRQENFRPVVCLARSSILPSLISAISPRGTVSHPSGDWNSGRVHRGFVRLSLKAMAARRIVVSRSRILSRILSFSPMGRAASSRRNERLLSMTL